MISLVFSIVVVVVVSSLRRQPCRRKTFQTTYTQHLLHIDMAYHKQPSDGYELDIDNLPMPMLSFCNDNLLDTICRGSLC